MKKIGVILLLFLSVFSLSSGRSRLKLADEIPWQLEYTYNKYGEKDKIKGAVYGQWARLKEIYIDKNGITVSITGQAYSISNLYEDIIKISFLFDSKKEIVVSDIKISKTEGLTGKAILIEKNNEKYGEIIKNIKKSNKMSILIENSRGETYPFSNINNKGSNLVISKVEKNL